VLWTSVVALLGAVVWVGGTWQYRSELSRIATELAESIPASKQRLLWLSCFWPEDPEVLFLLGACEEAEGNAEAADRAWARVPKTSPQAVDVAVRRAQLALARGRFADAEEALLALHLPPDHPASAACEQILLQIYLFTIRYEEIGQRKVKEWLTSHNP
jgi:hypothetical protein